MMAISTSTARRCLHAQSKILGLALMLTPTLLMAAGLAASESTPVQKPVKQTRAEVPALSLESAEIDALTATRFSDRVLLPDALPDKAASAIEFRRIRLHAPGAKNIGANGPVSRVERTFLLAKGSGQDFALALNGDGSFAFGFLLDAEGLHQLRQVTSAKGRLALIAETADAPKFLCEQDSVPFAPDPARLNDANSADMTGSSNRATASAKAGIAGYSAIIGIEVDQPMMSGRFAGSIDAADTWLDEMFLAVNLFYQRDLTLELLRGSTFYDTSSDTYTETSAVPLMFQFGGHWRTTYSTVPRSFAMLISGRLGAGAPTGVSWTDRYCQKGMDWPNPGDPTTAGSYGVALFNPASGISGASAAELLGHELGHQLGSEHNNCTDAQPGVAGFQPIDQCSNSGSSNGDECYMGPVSCPVSGAGTLMSTGCAGLAGCSLSRIREFHPAQISKLSAKIAVHSPACLTPTMLTNPDILYYNGFE